MYPIFKSLTIVSIAFNNEDELLFTLNSYHQCLEAGARGLVINGGKKFNQSNEYHKNVKLIEEKDDGIFDALNKGVNFTKTKYFVVSGKTISEIVNVGNFMSYIMVPL